MAINGLILLGLRELFHLDLVPLSHDVQLYLVAE